MNIYRSTLFLGNLFLFYCCTSSTQQKEDRISNPSPIINSTIEEEAKRAASEGPLMLSKDYGQTWINVSEGLPPEASVSFIEPYGNELILATDNLGVFISSNNRTIWKHVGKDLPNLKINALNVTGNTIWVGVYRQGIFESTDDGVTWVPNNEGLSNLNVQAIYEIEDILFVGTDAGLFKKSKNEKSWNTTSISNQVLSIYVTNGVLVIGTSRGTVISKDLGTSWIWIREEGAVHYTHPAGEAIVELCLNGDLFFSEDMGTTWGEFNYAPRSESYVYEIASIENFLLMSNNYGVHRSANNGKEWQLIYPTESIGFFDFLVVGKDIYGGTRLWDEYRGRK